MSKQGTDLADFIHNASDKEKKRVYKTVLRKAVKDQQKILNKL